MGNTPQKLGTLDGAALVVSTVIGAGIFTVPSLIASLTGSASGFIAVWVAGGVLAIAGALSYAELASRFPDAGGEYVYLREAFGPVAGFLSGWTSFIAGFSGAIAASAVEPAVYGYTSLVTSMPAARASSTIRRVCCTLPHAKRPAALWCEIWIATFASRPTRSVSSTLWTRRGPSSRMCDA